MVMSKARREQSAALRAMIAPLHKQGKTSAEISAEISATVSISPRSVSNHLVVMGLKPHGVALRIPKTLRRSLAAAQPRQEEDDTPPGPEWIMSNAEVVAKEQAKRALLRAMAGGPTEAQTRQLFALNQRLDLDRRARAALRRISQ